MLLSGNKNKGEARLGREREQKANFCLTAYAVRGIWVPSGIRVPTGYAVPPLENPDPSHPIRGPAAARSSISRRRVRRRRDPQKQLTARPALERFEGMSREEEEFFAAFEMTGERLRPAFFVIFSLAAAPCAKREQKGNFCLHAYAGWAGADTCAAIEAALQK